MNVEDVFGFNLKPKQDFGIEIPVPEKKKRPDGGFVAGTDEEAMSSDFYNTREEAIKEYPDDAGLEPGDTFFVGVAEMWQPTVDGNQFMEYFAEHAADTVGEASESWLQRVSGDQVRELERDLEGVFERWMEKFGHMPSFYEVRYVESYTVPEPPDAEPTDNLFLRGFERMDE